MSADSISNTEPGIGSGPDRIAAQIEHLVVEVGRVEPTDTAFSRSINLFDTGYLDSLGTVRLIAFIEERFAIRLSLEALTSPEFTTIDGMAGIVAGTDRDAAT